MRWFLFFLNVIFFCSFLYSQESNDTLRQKKIIELPEIKIIEQKIKSNTALDFAPIITIEQQQIQITGAKQLSELLIFSPGINIQNQGGIGGMKTLSIRGMSSARNLILLDGMPLNSPQNGSFDLNNIDVSMIDNIEIIRGGASSIFGGSAIGGAVNIITKKEIKEFFKAGLSYGSFNEKDITATLNVLNIFTGMTSPFDDENFSTNLIFNLNVLDADGNYPFLFSQYGKEKKYYRENADYYSQRFSALYRVSKTNNLEKKKIDWTTQFIYLKTDKGIPGPILQGQINTINERLEEKEYLFSTTLNFYTDNIFISHLIDNSIFKFSMIYRHDTLSYIEPNNDHKNSNFILDVITLDGIYNFIFLDVKNELLVTYSGNSLSGDMLDLDMENNVSRNILATGYRLEKDFLINNNALRFNLSGRYDIGLSNEKSTKKQSALTGSFGIIFKSKYIPLSIISNISHNFRFPNFNEMYYRNYGTKDLLPEKSNNINVGADYRLFDAINISLDGFYMDVRNMIIAIPTSPITWSAKNIARAESIGLEVSAILLDDIKFNKSLSINSISISYTLQQSLDKSINTQTYNKQLPYIPNELVSTLISFNSFDYIIGGKLEYSSHRYYLADNSANALLPSYYIVDLFIKSADIILYKDCKLNIRLDIKNIFNTQYTIINNYIMPQRQFRLSLGVAY